MCFVCLRLPLAHALVLFFSLLEARASVYAALVQRVPGLDAVWRAFVMLLFEVEPPSIVIVIIIIITTIITIIRGAPQQALKCRRAGHPPARGGFSYFNSCGARRCLN